MEEVKLLHCRFDKNLINQRHIVYEPPMPELAARLPGKSAGRAHTFPLYFPQLLLRLQADTVGNHRDKLGICRLALAGVDRVAEHLVHRLGSATSIAWRIARSMRDEVEPYFFAMSG